MDKFISTPSSSDVDLLIEKFRVEVSKSIDEASAETRKLTLTSTVKPKPSEVNNNIDQQITDLENLIRKLQNEITEMSQNADKEVEEYIPIDSKVSSEVRKDLSNETIILDNEIVNIEETESVKEEAKEKNSKQHFESEPYSHVFPLMLRDVLLPLDGGFKTLEPVITDTLNIESELRVPEETLSINQNVIDVWNDATDVKTNDNLEELISELQAEISEKMESLKDVISKESCDKFEDA